jgi:hypothetical protein
LQEVLEEHKLVVILRVNQEALEKVELEQAMLGDEVVDIMEVEVEVEMLK